MSDNEDKYYVGDVGTDVIVNCGQSIVGATDTTIEIEKPDGSKVSWVAEVYNSNYLKYVIKADDWDIPGIYKAQAKLTLGAWSGKGKTSKFLVSGDHS